FVGLAAGKNCETLDGKWYNQLGSEVFLKQEKDGTLYGVYITAVETHNGSSGQGHSIVLGSEMIIKQGEHGVIKGKYRTAVEEEPGAAGTGYSDLLALDSSVVQTALLFSLSCGRMPHLSRDGWRSVKSVVRIKRRSLKAHGYCEAR
ncbi:hypothetical protein OS493_039602, partial [Desmophyllum pertusum]